MENKYTKKSRCFSAKAGFTLIELMLVVLIIGILSGTMLGVINIRGIQAKSRDARRVGDIKKIQTALELYFADYRGYPKRTTWENVNLGATPLKNNLTPNYINKMPTDPLVSNPSVPKATPDGVSCFNGKNSYGYYYITTNCTGVGCTLSGKYVLGAIMEVETSASNDLCSQLTNCAGGAITCDCGGNFCYGAENP